MVTEKIRESKAKSVIDAKVAKSKYQTAQVTVMPQIIFCPSSCSRSKKVE